MKTISKANNYLETDFLKYARAILTQEDYVNKFKNGGTYDLILDDESMEQIRKEVMEGGEL